jgi:hypothetical protein
MSVKDEYMVKSIKTEETKEWLLYKHYAHRMPSISYSFGLYKDVLLIGVLTIGKPASPSLCDGVCGKEYSSYVFELNRLCVNDGLGRNVLSYFVGSSLKLLNKDMILVSYADTKMNHHGYIYQATNWLYTGITDLRYDKMVRGAKTHARHNNVYETPSDEFEMVERSRKHRYIYFIGNKRKRKVFFKHLNYEIKKYPKGENKRYNASHNVTTQIPLF